MPDTLAFKKSKNIAFSELDEQDRASLAALVADRWHGSTEDLAEKITDSEEAWDYFRRSRPTFEATSKEKDLATVSDTNEVQGVRMGVIHKVVNSLLAFLHNSTFPLDDRFFRGQATNDEAHDSIKQELYELHLARSFGISNVASAFRMFRLHQILDGTAAARVVFRRKKRKKTVWQRSMEQQDLDFFGLKIPVTLSDRDWETF